MNTAEKPVSRKEYIEDPYLFPCNWRNELAVPDWMHDFEEKIAAFADPNGRMMSTTHRADWVNYPENSIEAVISAINMGVDNIELDARKTRDGVVILFHDTTLERMTDWDRKAGKNGLPSSDRVLDWTYEELTQLRLRKNDGLLSVGGPLTEYIIPTFEEVLRVCRERITIRLDKLDAWDWDADIYPLIRKTGAWRTVIPNIEFGLERQKEICAAIQADSGMNVPVWYQSAPPSAWCDFVEERRKETGCAPMLRIGIDQPNMRSYVEKLEPYLAQIRGKARLCTDMFTTACGTENAETWHYLWQKGFRLVLVDKGVGLQRYIAENFSPTGRGSGAF